MNENLYKNVVYSIRAFFQGLKPSSEWYIDTYSENLPDSTADEFFVLSSSVGRRDDEKLPYQYDFAQILCYSKNDVEALAGEILAGTPIGQAIPIKDFANSLPDNILGHAQITRRETAATLVAGVYGVKAISVYFQIIE